ncbi:mucin-2-like [Ylistrum balloti]|uniref:mucin-2-like n=1 Tax=Ylistrum balloti TaxID=509963 RepID=UPI002905CA15|nr:mucin-2-like [Ylistrum balloti]
MPVRQTRTPKRTTSRLTTDPESPTNIGTFKSLSPKTPGWMSGRHAVFKTPESPSEKRPRTRRSSMYQSKTLKNTSESQSKATNGTPPVAKRTRRSFYRSTTLKLVDIPLSPEPLSPKTTFAKGVSTRTRKLSMYHKENGVKLNQITEETVVTQKGRKESVSKESLSSVDSHNKQEEAKTSRSAPQKRKAQTQVKSPKTKMAKVSSPIVPGVKVKQLTERKTGGKTAAKSTKKNPQARSLKSKTPAKSTRSSGNTSLVQDEVSLATKSTPVNKMSAQKSKKTNTPDTLTPVVPSKTSVQTTKTPASQRKATAQGAKTLANQNKAKSQVLKNETKTPVNQSNAKTPVLKNETKTSASQNEAKIHAADKKTETSANQNKAKKPVVKNETKTSVSQNKTKTPVVDKKTETPANQNKAKTIFVKSETKTSASQNKAKTPVVDKKTETAANQNKAKTLFVKNEVKTSVNQETPALKSAANQSKAKTPASEKRTKISTVTSTPVKETPVFKPQIPSLTQNMSAKKRKLSAANGAIMSPQASKKLKSGDSEHGFTNVKSKSVVVLSPHDSGDKRLKTPKALPKTPVVRRKVTPARRAEVLSTKIDNIPVHEDSENEPFNITLNDVANTSITSQDSNELNSTYSHSSRCIIL